MLINKQKINDNLINEAGNTIFKNIYIDCQNEIKDFIITNLLNKIKTLNSKIDLLEKQNKKLKDNLIYILKRILSNKTQYNNIYNYNSKYNIFVNKRTDNDSRNTFKILETNYSKEKNKANYSIVNYPKTHRYNTEINNIYYSLLDSESDNDKIKELKATKYLNNLYKKYFCGYTNGTPYSYFINKDKSIYEELFPKAEKNNILLLNTFSNNESPKKCQKNHIRNKSTDYKETFDIDDNDIKAKLFSEKKEKNNFIHLLNKIKKLNIDVKKRNKNKKKTRAIKSVDDKNDKKKYINIKNVSFLNISNTDKTTSFKNHKNKLLYRSPYLNNKL